MSSAVPLTHLAVAVALSGALVATGSPPARAGAAADRPALVSADTSPPQARDVRFSRAAAAGCVALIGPAARRQRPALLAYRVASAPACAVPAAAMLQPADLNGAPTTAVTDDYWAALRPPQPCGPYASAGLRRSDRAVQAMIGVGDRPTVILNDVATYRSDGAHRYLKEVRRGVRACGGEWSVLGTGVAGDESLLLRRREFIDYAQRHKDTYVVVARTGRALVVVADTGWETASGHEALARSLSVAAVRRAAVVSGR